MTEKMKSLFGEIDQDLESLGDKDYTIEEILRDDLTKIILLFEESIEKDQIQDRRSLYKKALKIIKSGKKSGGKNGVQ